MKCKKIVVWLGLLLCMPAALAAEDPAGPCEAAGFRQFDFWLGQWEVRVADGRMAGNNSIERAQQGCLIVESWTNVQGGTGTSFNFYSPVTDEWRQVWVSPGAIIDIVGGLEDAAMVLEGRITYTGEEQTTVPFRGTWSPLPDGRVRQFFEEARVAGEWKPWFEGFYARTDG